MTYLLMLDTLARTVTRYGALIHRVWLMPNHFHTLIQVQDVPLNTILKQQFLNV